jgi:DNA helicase-2/ATP-dependent DNA helicase PcrA
MTRPLVRIVRREAARLGMLRAGLTLGSLLERAAATAGVYNLKVGDDVAHATFGEGIILDIEGQGDKAEATIRFPDVGEKRLLLSWAPLERVSP